MTQKAPERIKIAHSLTLGVTFEKTPAMKSFFPLTEYIRADHALALVAEAYEDAGDAAADVYERRDLPTGADLAGYIRTIATDDAQAALERVKQEARNEALREAADVATDAVIDCGDDQVQVRFAVLDLITEDQSDE